MDTLRLRHAATLALVILSSWFTFLLGTAIAPAPLLAANQPGAGVANPGLASTNDLRVVIAGTSAAHTLDNEVTIGEVITYSVNVTVVEGYSGAVVLTATLTDGLALVSKCAGISASPSITTSIPLTSVCSDATVSDSGTKLLLSFGTLGNSNKTASTAETVTVQISAVVLNTATNTRERVLTTKARWRWTSPSASYVNSSEIVFVSEPSLTLRKSVAVGQPSTGQSVPFTLEVHNWGQLGSVARPADAFDVVVTDSIPAGLTFDDNVTTLQGPAPDSFEHVAGVITATWNQLGKDVLSQLRYRARVDANVSARTVLTNHAGLVATSLPGAPSQPISPYNGASTERSGSDTGSQADVYRGTDFSFVTVTVPDLRITKDDSVAAVEPGDTLTYTVNLTNTGNQHADKVVITETVPDNTTFIAGRSSPGWSCPDQSPAGTLCAYALSGSNDPLPAGRVVGNLRFVVRLANPVLHGGRLITNTIVIGDAHSHGVDPTPSNNVFTDVDELAGELDLAVTKQAQASAGAGGQLTYTISYTNAGSSAARAIVLTETVPAQTRYSGSGWSCSPAAGPTGATCTYLIASLASGEHGAVPFVVTIDATLPAGVATVTNTVSIGSEAADANPANDSSTVFTPVTAPPDLAIAISDGGHAAPGSHIDYTLSYTNSGGQPASGVVLTQTVSQHATYAGSGWTCVPAGGSGGSVCTLPVGTLGTGAHSTATFSVVVDSPVAAGVASASSTADIGDDGAGGPDPTPENNSKAITTEVDAAPDLAISKHGGEAAPAGGTINYTISFTNSGNQSATGVVLSETVPEYTTYNGSGWSCTPSSAAGSTCARAIGDLAGGGGHGEAAFAVSVDSSLSAGVGAITNTVTVADDGANGADPALADNSATASTPVIAQPDLAVTADDGGVGATPGGDVVYTITYSNSGNQGASGVVVTETVPAATVFKPGLSNPGWLCVSGGAGSGCTFVVGGLPAGASGAVSFTLTVADPAPTGMAQVVNTVRVGDDGANGPDPTAANNTATDTTPLTSAPEFQIAKEASSTAALPASIVSYTLSYTNAGNVGASGVIITETVPALSTYAASASSAGWTCSAAGPGSVCTLDVGSVVGGGGGGIAFFAVTLDNPIAEQASPITMTNTVRIGDDGANGADPNLANNSATVTIGVKPTVFAAYAWSPTAGQGYAARYTIVLQNTGADAMHNVVITDILPLHTRFGDVTIAAITATPPDLFSGWGASGGVYDGNGSIVWDVGEVPAGYYATAKVLVYVYSSTPPGTVLTNTAILRAGGMAPIASEAHATVVTPAPLPQPTATATPTPGQPPQALCPAGPSAGVDAGSSAPYVDSEGHLWLADQEYVEGLSTWGYTGQSFIYATQHSVVGTADPALYQSERWWPSAGGYRFAVANGSYEVRLKLAEIYPWAAIGSRTFAVSIEGSVVASHLDVLAHAGRNTAYDLVTTVTVQDGVLQVDLIGESGSPSLKAISYRAMRVCSLPGPPTVTPVAFLLPTPSPTPAADRPARCEAIRIDAGASAPHTDGSGSLWLADRPYTPGATSWGYAGAGGTYVSTSAIAGADAPYVYQTQRWWEGNGGYRIAVPNATYLVTLKFAEIYPWSYPGSRAFDVKIEDALVLSHLDVAGLVGRNTAHDVTFTVTVSDGVLDIELVKRQGSPAINGIEVVPVGGCGADDS